MFFFYLNVVKRKEKRERDHGAHMHSGEIWEAIHNKGKHDISGMHLKPTALFHPVWFERKLQTLKGMNCFIQNMDQLDNSRYIML